MISTEHDMGRGSRQYSWLEQDLKSVDRIKTPWIIVAGHRPMYTSTFARRNVNLFFNFTLAFTLVTLVFTICNY